MVRRKGQRRRISVMLMSGILSLPASHSCAAFQTAFRGRRARNKCTRFTATNSDDDGPSEDGGELAGKFYDQLRRREDQMLSGDADRIDPTSKLPPQEVETYGGPPRPRKFTGASQSLFSSDDQPASTNIQREREREFNLASRFERTFGIQVAILAVSIAYVASVGLSGGITDGSDRDFGGFDDLDDTVVERFRTDDAAEVLSRQSSIQGSQWL